jgi:hypothetical protein
LPNQASVSRLFLSSTKIYRPPDRLSVLIWINALSALPGLTIFKRLAGVGMPYFTFEIVRPEGAPFPAGVFSLSDCAAAWCFVELLACRNKDANAYIRVVNSDGEMVIRSGVSAALASIRTCRRANCPLKQIADA